MFREEILENENRRTIFNFIKKNPGLHLREIQRRLKMPLSSLDYHLGYLVRKTLLYKEGDGFYTRYYDEELNESEREILAALRQKRMREILLIILSKGKIKYQDLLGYLGIPASTLSLHLKRLVDNNILVRHQISRESVYTIENEGIVSKLLITYKSSFLDKLVDRALNTWMETHFRRPNPKKEGM